MGKDGTTMERLNKYLQENGKEYYEKITRESESVLENERIRKEIIDQKIIEVSEALNQTEK